MKNCDFTTDLVNIDSKLLEAQSYSTNIFNLLTLDPGNETILYALQGPNSCGRRRLYMRCINYEHIINSTSNDMVSCSDNSSPKGQGVPKSISFKLEFALNDFLAADSYHNENMMRAIAYEIAYRSKYILLINWLEELEMSSGSSAYLLPMPTSQYTLPAQYTYAFPCDTVTLGDYSINVQWQLADGTETPFVTFKISFEFGTSTTAWSFKVFASAEDSNASFTLVSTSGTYNPGLINPGDLCGKRLEQISNHSFSAIPGISHIGGTLNLEGTGGVAWRAYTDCYNGDPSLWTGAKLEGTTDSNSPPHPSS